MKKYIAVIGALLLIGTFSSCRSKNDDGSHSEQLYIKSQTPVQVMAKKDPITEQQPKIPLYTIPKTTTVLQPTLEISAPNNTKIQKRLLAFNNDTYALESPSPFVFPSAFHSEIIFHFAFPEKTVAITNENISCSLGDKSLEVLRVTSTFTDHTEIVMTVQKTNLIPTTPTTFQVRCRIPDLNFAIDAITLPPTLSNQDFVTTATPQLSDKLFTPITGDQKAILLQTFTITNPTQSNIKVAIPYVVPNTNSNFFYEWNNIENSGPYFEQKTGPFRFKANAMFVFWDTPTLNQDSVANISEKANAATAEISNSANRFILSLKGGEKQNFYLYVLTRDPILQSTNQKCSKTISEELVPIRKSCLDTYCDETGLCNCNKYQTELTKFQTTKTFSLLGQQVNLELPLSQIQLFYEFQNINDSEFSSNLELSTSAQHFWFFPSKLDSIELDKIENAMTADNSKARTECSL